MVLAERNREKRTASVGNDRIDVAIAGSSIERDPGTSQPLLLDKQP